MVGIVPTKKFEGEAMKHPIQFRKLRSVFRSPAVQGIAADALQNLSTASLIACGYLLLFAHDNAHAHRLLWVVVLALDGVVAFVCSADLQGDTK